MKNVYRDYLEFAVETAYQAGQITLGYFRNGVQVDFKEDDTPVTVADRKAEELIRWRIESQFPGHAIVGEEFGSSGGKDATHRWFIDPIDGTKSFVRGVPMYGVLIGLEVEGRIEVGVAHFPALNEMVYAATGMGCFCNGRRTRVMETDRMSSSFVGFTDPMSFERSVRKAAWEKLKQAAGYLVGWSDAYGHACVAAGRLELMLDPALKPWDWSPFPVIMREAGGCFCDWTGKETIFGSEAMSTTKKLLPEVLEIISAAENGAGSLKTA
jgi:myo-inositol-1(or 4)-monophosphatase